MLITLFPVSFRSFAKPAQMGSFLLQDSSKLSPQLTRTHLAFHTLLHGQICRQQPSEAAAGVYYPLCRALQPVVPKRP